MASKTEKKETPQDRQYLSPIQNSILEMLKEFGPMMRDQLCERFGFGKHIYSQVQSYPNKKEYKNRYHRKVEQFNKRTTIYDNLLKLQKRKLVEKFSSNNGKRGRPFIFWKIKEV